MLNKKKQPIILVELTFKKSCFRLFLANTFPEVKYRYRYRANRLQRFSAYTTFKIEASTKVLFIHHTFYAAFLKGFELLYNYFTYFCFKYLQIFTS